jgi:hypothetical protein
MYYVDKVLVQSLSTTLKWRGGNNLWLYCGLLCCYSVKKYRYIPTVSEEHAVFTSLKMAEVTQDNIQLIAMKTSDHTQTVTHKDNHWWSAVTGSSLLIRDKLVFLLFR